MSQDIRDGSGKLIGRVTTNTYGESELRNGSGKLIGRESQGVTRSETGSVVARGAGSILSALNRK